MTTKSQIQDKSRMRRIIFLYYYTNVTVRLTAMTTKKIIDHLLCFHQECPTNHTANVFFFLNNAKGFLQNNSLLLCLHSVNVTYPFNLYFSIPFATIEGKKNIH